MSGSILNKPVSRGKLWGAGYTWSEAIEAHAEHCRSGCVRFEVSDEGIWMLGDGSRGAEYRTRLPKGAEDYARAVIEQKGLVQSSRNPALFVAPNYA